MQSRSLNIKLKTVFSKPTPTALYAFAYVTGHGITT